MSDVKALTENIIGQARTEAEQITRQATAEAESILQEARQKAAERSAKLAADYQQKILILEQRLRIEAELEGKKRMLAAKHQLIERVFEETLKALKKLPAKKRNSFLARKLAEAGSEHGGEVLAVGSRAEWTAIIKEANELLARSGKIAQLVLSSKIPDLEDGFLLKGPGFTVDGSYQAILSEIKEETIPEIAQYLFEAEKR
ncbi:MAG TPA: V-type ATP synthase subunit E family protein [Bacillota bacterium]